MNNYKETAAFNVPKEHFANLKDDSGFQEHIAKHISSELAQRIMRILEYEKEVIVRQSDLRVNEFTPTNSVEYRRQINWSPLVRCKDCRFCGYDEMFDEMWCNGKRVSADWFCADGERREDEAD